MRKLVALLSLPATYLFFFEYLPPLKRVHFFSDIEGYHYPLLNYAFKSLRDGRFPEWDPTIYCGLSFAGNVQAGLFYPPNWLLFASNWHRSGLRFTAIEALLILHFWLAFLLAFLWLGSRIRSQLAAAAGAAVFAFAGYAVSEAQHFGVLCGFAWFPLGLWGIEEASAERRWRPLWKVAVASALILMAGYPPAWFVFCVAACVYAICRQCFPGAAIAVVFSLPLAAVQILPSLEASSLKLPEKAYGAGLSGGAFFYLSYLLPNYYDQSHRSGRVGEPHEQYLYIGAAAIVALLWLLRRRRIPLDALAITATSLLFFLNPARVIEWIADRTPLVNNVCREWNFLAAVALAAAIIAAVGLDDLLAARKPWLNRWAGWGIPALGLLWCLRQWLVWRAGGGFATGWWTLGEVAVTAALVLALLRLPQRATSTAALILLIWVEYKVYGTSRRFNSIAGDVDRNFAGDARVGGPDFKGVDPAVYSEMRTHPEYRIALEQGPHGTDLRHYGLTTPQGFDPFLPAQYFEAVARFTDFETNRIFRIPPSNTAMLEAFAVRYVLTPADSESQKELSADPRFRLLEPAKSYYQVFEYRDAKPAFRFDAGQAARVRWLPGERMFRIRSETGGEFHLLEQFFPGWHAYVDGQEVPVTRVGTAFQGIPAPAGEHWIEFRFRSAGLRAGGAISAAALLSLLVFLYASGSAPGRRPRPRPPGHPYESTRTDSCPGP